MKYILALVAALALAACGDDAPKPKPQAKAPPPPPPVAAAPKPEPKPEPPENKLPSGAIDVTAADGRVSLWGTVASNGQKNKAMQVAKKVEGVKSVDNQLKVVRGS